MYRDLGKMVLDLALNKVGDSVGILQIIGREQDLDLLSEKPIKIPQVQVIDILGYTLIGQIKLGNMAQLDLTTSIYHSIRFRHLKLGVVRKRIM